MIHDERLTQILEHFPYILESLQKLEKPSSQDLKDCEKVLDAMVEDFLEEIGEQMVFKDNN
ncbi:hypothetical protein [Helicobacter suis]|uniref:hypothetical protein n=1 Tax=Helicobacter suis TaxID=104628 RepID=UPI00247FDD65|nr:hypothetical protein [Helicobacter suis]